ncbi:hypothetical protein ACI65C_009053 [Semiaphis heraclei]
MSRIRLASVLPTIVMTVADGWVRSERRPSARHCRCRVWLSGAPAGGATLRSDRRAADVTSREHTVTRAHTHAQTYEAAAAADSHNGVPPTDRSATDTAVRWPERRRRERKNAHDERTAHILQFAFCPSAGHKCQLLFRSLITRLPLDVDVATRSLVRSVTTDAAAPPRAHCESARVCN